MTANVEWLLIAVIVALYLKDSMLLLDPDEAILIRRGGGRWDAGFGMRRFRLSGREPWLANPFMPHRPVMRLRWAMRGEAVAREDATDMPRLPMALAALVWWNWTLLLLVIPMLLIGYRDVGLIVFAVIALYLGIGMSLLLVWQQRSALSISARAFGVLSFECLACAPVAINLIRKVSLARSVDEDFLHAMERLLDDRRQRAARANLVARLDDQLEIEADDEGLAQAMRRLRARLAEPVVE
ncbi:hypothetical protein BH10PSE17_BH10PSE17_13820 [soil metagenome]